MLENISEETSASIDVLIEYKKGLLNLSEAAERFSFFTGMPSATCRKFIKNMSRDNLLTLDLKKHNREKLF